MQGDNASPSICLWDGFKININFPLVKVIFAWLYMNIGSISYAAFHHLTLHSQNWVCKCKTKQKQRDIMQGYGLPIVLIVFQMMNGHISMWITPHSSDINFLINILFIGLILNNIIFALLTIRFCMEVVDEEERWGRSNSRCVITQSSTVDLTIYLSYIN